ncbi:Glucooligosaccharide oxidase [Lentithecium fluviatile CBS 122367]|uniref:Glucooligosaccharide oxidase n=1 Tax=Lentithecium fluviatile CBS 122367 TaxID=1168545 RepID=A0A6G1JFL3_9PLEO|nr:Glucooligosaccharide oxidase [Lentithecium fluviatile CBS 122367]
MQLLTTIATGVLAASLVSAKPAENPGTSSQQIADCLGKKDVPVYWPNSPNFTELAEPFNLRLSYTPYVIVLPETIQHVQDAVLCAAECGIKVQAKSGGHSYASFSSGGKDGSMMIDLQPMQGIELDPATNIVKVGGGVRLGNLAQGVWDQGKRGISHGTCPGVGIGGHFTHGGYGHTSRNWGLALDHIVALDVVLADGSVVHASEVENFKLYWAMRGAAESFGVVCNFYLRTQEAPASVTYFSFQWGDALFKDKQAFTDVFMHIQDFSTNASVVDNRISYGIYLDGIAAYNLGGTFFGSPEEFNSTIMPELLRSIPAPGKIIVQAYEWIPYLKLMSDRDAIEEPLTGYDEHDTFFAKSITVPESEGLARSTLDAFYDYISTPAPTEYFVIINLYGGPGSAINMKDTDFAAYADRDSLWVFQNYGHGDTIREQGSIDFVNGINEAIIEAQPDTHFGAYLNYVDPSYDAETAHELYYGEALYAKLDELKAKYDPKHIFWNPQSIGN